MTTRELFEKLHPVPEGVEFIPAENTYGAIGLADRLNIKAAAHQRTLWQGFQSGTAAGMEPLEPLANEFPELNMSNFSIDDVSALNDWGIAMVTAIRAMKGEVK